MDGENVETLASHKIASRYLNSSSILLPLGFVGLILSPSRSLFLIEFGVMGVVIAVQCNGREGSLFNRFWGSSNDQFRRAWERTETKADKPVGNNQARLTPARASLCFTEGDEQLGDFFLV